MLGLPRTQADDRAFVFVSSHGFRILVLEFVLLAVESKNAIGARRELLDLEGPLGRDPTRGEAAGRIGQRDAIHVRTRRHRDRAEPGRAAARAGRRSRHAFDGPVDRGAVVAQHDVNGKAGAARADYKRLAQEIGAPCNS